MEKRPEAAPGGATATVQAWPIGRRALDALYDLGLGDDDLARYFRVPRQEIGAARARLRDLG